MEVKINKLDKHHIVRIDDADIPNVTDYTIKISSDGFTELDLKIKIPTSVMELCLSEN